MTAPNHIAGGYCFTGIIGSILGVNILGDYRILIIIGIASLLPDIDHTKSLIGKSVYPLAKFLNRHYGHRTITHSIFALVGLTAIIAAFQSVYFPELPAATFFGLAYGSHLLFDCMTIQGVPLLYPFKKNPFVLPGNPQMRIRTSNVQHESIAFCFFIVSAVFMKPLVANGFWTTYNTLFGTYKHLVSEYHKSEDLLHVTFAVQRGSEIDTLQGLVVDMEGSGLTIIDKRKRFMTFPQEGQLITDFVPRHTGMKYAFVEGDLIEVTADSLMRFVASHKCSKMNVQASTKFVMMENGVEVSNSKLVLKYPNRIYIKDIITENKARYTVNPGIQAARDQISTAEQRYASAMSAYTAEMNTYEALKHEMEVTTDYVKKQILMERFQDVKMPVAPPSIEDKIQDLHLRIKTLKQEDQMQYQKERDQYIHTPLTFTGTYEKLQINGKDI